MGVCYFISIKKTLVLQKKFSFKHIMHNGDSINVAKFYVLHYHNEYDRKVPSELVTRL